MGQKGISLLHEGYRRLPRLAEALQLVITALGRQPEKLAQKQPGWLGAAPRAVQESVSVSSLSEQTGTEEVAQWLRTRAVCAEDVSSADSTHITVDSHAQPYFRASGSSSELYKHQTLSRTTYTHAGGAFVHVRFEKSVRELTTANFLLTPSAIPTQTQLQCFSKHSTARVGQPQYQKVEAGESGIQDHLRLYGSKFWINLGYIHPVSVNNKRNCLCYIL